MPGYIQRLNREKVLGPAELDRLESAGRGRYSRRTVQGHDKDKDRTRTRTGQGQDKTRVRRRVAPARYLEYQSRHAGDLEGGEGPHEER